MKYNACDLAFFIQANVKSRSWQYSAGGIWLLSKSEIKRVLNTNNYQTSKDKS